MVYKEGARSLLNIVPAGVVVCYASSTVPDHWLSCDGTEYDGDIYTELYNAIGTTFGGDSSANRFKVPDIRGIFVRGYEDGSHSIGETQNSVVGEHKHTGETGNTDLSHSHNVPEVVNITNTNSDDPYNSSDSDNQDGDSNDPVSSINWMIYLSNFPNSTSKTVDNSLGNHSHTFTTDKGNNANDTNNSLPSETYPKNICLQYIIKY